MPTTPEQIDAWRADKSETDSLEFKEARNHFDFERLLEYCVALSNEGGGSLLLGIAGKPPCPIVGTVAFPNIDKTTRAILSRLKFQVDVEDVQHPDGRVLIFHVPPHPIGQPQHIGGAYFIRRGQSLTRMTTAQLERAFRQGGNGIKLKFAARRPDAYKLLTIAASTLLLVVGFASLYQWRVAPAVSSLTKGVRHPGPQSTIKPSKDWRNAKDWQKFLHLGMTKDDVRQLFGEADDINLSQNFETWHYGFGIITFYEGKIYSWLPPD